MRQLADADRIRLFMRAQALAKIERGHSQDREDVRTMLRRGLIEPTALREYFAAIQTTPLSLSGG